MAALWWQPPSSPWPRCRRCAISGRAAPVDRRRRGRARARGGLRRSAAPAQVVAAAPALRVDGVDDHRHGIVQAALGVDVEQVDGVLDLLAGVLDVLEGLGRPRVRRPRLDVLTDDDDRQEDELDELGGQPEDDDGRAVLLDRRGERDEGDDGEEVGGPHGADEDA